MCLLKSFKILRFLNNGLFVQLYVFLGDCDTYWKDVEHSSEFSNLRDEFKRKTFAAQFLALASNYDMFIVTSIATVQNCYCQNVIAFVSATRVLVTKQQHLNMCICQQSSHWPFQCYRISKNPLRHELFSKLPYISTIINCITLIFGVRSEKLSLHILECAESLFF